MNADHAGAIICEVLWNQELVLESVIQLIFLGLMSLLIFIIRGILRWPECFRCLKGSSINS